MFNDSVFKSYDIRGIYGLELNLDLTKKLAHAMKILYKPKTVVIGYDMRISSKQIFSVLCNELILLGISVTDIGLVTTPMLNFAVANKLGNMGIMISASHNPKEYNAFKIIGPGPLQIGINNGLLVIKTQIISNIKANFSSKPGQYIKVAVLNTYINWLLSLVHISNTKKITICCDFGNGVGAISALPAYKYFKNITVKSLFKIPNGNFPNHTPDPHNLENFKFLQKSVIKNKSDIGIFYDGDADRSYFVDETGNIIMQDILICLLAEYELLKNKNVINKNIYYDLRFTKQIESIIKHNGGYPIMLQVGNPTYKYNLLTKGGLLAAEFSGHTMYYSNYCIDDGLFTSLKVLEILSHSKYSISYLINKYKVLNTSEEISIKILSNKSFNDLITVLKAKFKDYNELNLDGLYLYKNDKWFNLRKSGTEPVLRFRCEAKHLSDMLYIKNTVIDIVNTFYNVK